MLFLAVRQMLDLTGNERTVLTTVLSVFLEFITLRRKTKNVHVPT